MPDLTPLELLKNQIDISKVPFTDRGARLLVMRNGHTLNIRLAERWLKLDHRLAAYRERLPLVGNFTFTDSNGCPLEFNCDTYPHKLDFHTPSGDFSMTFMDTETLLIAIPPVSCGISFNVQVDQGLVDRRGGLLRMTGNIRRNIAYTTNRPMTVNVIQPGGEGYLQVQIIFSSGPRAGFLLNLTPRLGFNRHVPDIDSTFTAAARQWEEWFAAVPDVAKAYRQKYYYAWWVLRAGLISTRYYTTRAAMAPSKLYYVGVWQWDAYFHALAYRHIDDCLAEDQLRIILDHQRQDGMLPDAVHDEGTVTHLNFPVDADVTKPPLLGWSAWKLYEASGDKEFLEEIYEPMVHWNQWWFEKNDLDNDGLCEYLHPFSSGLDDSPLWDAGMPVTAPDLNTYLVLQMDALANIAHTLGLSHDARFWQERSQILLDNMIKYLWDGETGYFWAKRNGQIIPVRTPFNLFPLVTGRLPKNIAKRLVEHLTNPLEFWTHYPVPTVARNDPNYDHCNMWRGPVWVNSNYLLIEGLERSGYKEIARQLRKRTLDLLCSQPDLVEYYNPDTGEPCPKAAPMFGWSAALMVELALDHKK
jgi:putative isomerase